MVPLATAEAGAQEQRGQGSLGARGGGRAIGGVGVRSLRWLGPKGLGAGAGRQLLP